MKALKEYNEFCEKTLFPALEECEDRRKSIMSKRHSLLLLVLILIVAQVIVILLGYIPLWTIFIAMFVVPFIFGFAYNRFFRDEDLEADVQDIVIKESIKFLFLKPSFDERLSVPYNYFADSQIFLQLPENYEGKNLTKGTFGKYPTLFSEIDCGYTENAGGKETWHTIFSGIFAIVAFEKKLDANIVVIPSELEKELYLIGKHIQKHNFYRGQSVPFDDDKEFMKHYVAYSDQPMESVKLISAEIRNLLLNFKQKMGIEVSLSIIGNKINFAFGAGSLLSLNLKDSILDFEQIKSIYLCFSCIELVLMDISKRYIIKAGTDWSI
ncbi:MAG: DUF3137 domain-containing protein [Cytophagales bacterium]|nr:MAG: DUF3137 domain-containing protein [Cytophagales bacterium]